MRYELPPPQSVRLWRQSATYSPNDPTSRPLCSACKEHCTTLFQVCGNNHQPEPWGWKPLCTDCHITKGDDWVKAHLWRLSISLPEMALDRALGIDHRGRLLGADRALAARLGLAPDGSPSAAGGDL